MYTALKKSNTKSGDWVVIPGAGGGLGHLGRSSVVTGKHIRLNITSAIQYAAAKGLRVLAIGRMVDNP